ncbi:MAG: flavodoxin family protein [Blautia sp.]
MKTQVLYKSRTGNTEKLAKAVFGAIPGKNKDIAPLEGQTDYDMGDVYFIGFWTDRGSASVDVLDYLGSLQGKRIALFGTCGMGGSPEYYKKIEENIRVFIEDDNEYLGAFICQGKMPMAVREKYMNMKNSKNQKQVEAMIRNFDMAMLHPNEQDLEHVRNFVKHIYEKLEEEAKKNG